MSHYYRHLNQQDQNRCSDDNDFGRGEPRPAVVVNTAAVHADLDILFTLIYVQDCGAAHDVNPSEVYVVLPDPEPHGEHGRLGLRTLLLVRYDVAAQLGPPLPSDRLIVDKELQLCGGDRPERGAVEGNLVAERYLRLVALNARATSYQVTAVAGQSYDCHVGRSLRHLQGPLIRDR